MYSLVEYSNNYLKATEILWQYCRDEPPVDAANGNMLILVKTILLLLCLKLNQK